MLFILRFLGRAQVVLPIGRVTTDCMLTLIMVLYFDSYGNQGTRLVVTIPASLASQFHYVERL